MRECYIEWMWNVRMRILIEIFIEFDIVNNINNLLNECIQNFLLFQGENQFIMDEFIKIMKIMMSDWLQNEERIITSRCEILHEESHRFVHLCQMEIVILNFRIGLQSVPMSCMRSHTQMRRLTMIWIDCIGVAMCRISFNCCKADEAIVVEDFV